MFKMETRTGAFIAWKTYKAPKNMNFRLAQFNWRIEVAARFNFVTFVCGILFISIIIILLSLFFPLVLTELRKITAENVLLNC